MVSNKHHVGCAEAFVRTPGKPVTEPELTRWFMLRLYVNMAICTIFDKCQEALFLQTRDFLPLPVCTHCFGRNPED